MPFISITPPVNAQFVPAYNAILEGCRKRGFCMQLNTKEVQDSVTQEDMNQIRTEVWNARQNFFIPERLDLSLDDPFQDSNAWPKINDDQGFLEMPGAYALDGVDIFKPGPAFSASETPVLWEHFTDLIAIIHSFQFRLCEYALDCEITREQLKIDFHLLKGENPSDSLSSVYNTATRKVEAAWSVNYTVTGHSHEAVSTGIGYYRLENENWSCLAEPIALDSVKLMVNKVLPSVKFNAPEGAAWRGVCKIQPASRIDHVIDAVNPGFLDDEILNGIVKVGCDSCCSLLSNPLSYLLEAMRQVSGKVKVPLAMSAPDCNDMKTVHFMATYHFAGNTYGQYNCDTRIESRFLASGKWKICYLRRPSGALIPFYWKGDTGIPMNAFHYRLSGSATATSGEGLHFPDRISHFFGRHDLVNCRYRGENAFYWITPPGRGVTRSGSGSSYHFFCAAVGDALLTVGRYKKPLSFRYGAQTFAGRAAVTDDVIAQILQSSDPADAADLTFDDFYPAGEAPQWDTPVLYEIMTFLNSAGTELGKFVGITWQNGDVGRGYWRKEGTALMPSELSLFEREFDPEDAALFLEVDTVIKYGASGRQQSIARREKRRFAFGEKILREFRKYGTADQLEATFNYGENPAAGDFGQLTASTDFDGGWSRYEYDGAGRLTKEISPFLDAEPDTDEALCRVVSYDYAPLQESELSMEVDRRPRTVITRVLGTEIGREYHQYFEYETRDIVAAAPGAAFDAPGNFVTRRHLYAAGDFAGWHWKTENPDGSVSISCYEKINVVQNEAGEEIYELKTTVENGFLPGSGTRQIQLRDSNDNILWRNTFDIASGLQISGVNYTYDRYGRVLTETTMDGDVTETEYNCCGPRFITAPDGSVTEYAYDAFNRLTFALQSGVTVFHVYDARDNEIVTTRLGKDGGELATLYEFDPDGVLISETDPAGAMTQHQSGAGYELVTDVLGGTRRSDYYRDGRLKSVSGTAAAPLNYTYGIQAGELFARESASETEWTQTITDFSGRSYKRIFADNYAETTFYDANGRILRTENTEGRRILNFYDATTGNLKYQVLKRSAGDEIDWTADQVTEYASGYRLRDGDTVVRYQETYQFFDGVRTLVASQESSRDGKRTWTFQKGRLTATSRTFGETDGETLDTTVNFDGSTIIVTSQDGIPQHSTHSISGTTEFVYDEFNREIGRDRMENAELIATRYTLDAIGRRLTVTESAGGSSRTTTYTYNALGAKLTETSPEGIATIYTYDTRGALTEVSGGSYQRNYAYDAQGRLSSFTTCQDENTTAATVFGYDCRGRRISKSYADGSAENSAWRGDGKPASRTNVRNQIQTFTYNVAGELLRVETPELLERNFSYDLNGRLTGVTDATGSAEIGYDAYDNQISESFPSPSGAAATVTRSYDALQRKTGLLLASAPLSGCVYGTDGRLSEVVVGNATLAYAYRPGTNQIASRAWRIGEGAPFLTIAHDYDAGSRLTGIRVNGVAEISYVLNDDNQRTGATLSDGSVWSYGYDAKGQLLSAGRTGADETALNAMSYVYDEIGNRRSSAEDGISRNYTSNLLNQYTAINAETPTCDADGNMLTNGAWSYSWNVESRLTTATNGTVTLEFQYDYMGRRVEKKVTENETVTKHERYVYDGYKLIAIRDLLNGNALLMTFVWQEFDLDIPLAMNHGGQTYFYLTDGNKNVTGLFDAAGTRVATYAYGPFGELLTSTGPLSALNPLRFSSEFHDLETDLIYYNYRYYAPTLGRWTRRDPVEEQGGFNLYAMVQNNAINIWDEKGLFIIKVRNQYISQTTNMSKRVMRTCNGKVQLLG